MSQLREQENNQRTMAPALPRPCSIWRRGEEGRREEGEGGTIQGGKNRGTDGKVKESREDRA